MERQKDYRLDFRVVRYCKGTIKRLCGEAEERTKAWSGDVNACLKGKLDKIEDGRCKLAVQGQIKIASENFGMDEHIHESCRYDSVKLCCRNSEAVCDDAEMGEEVSSPATQTPAPATAQTNPQRPPRTFN